MPPHPSHPIAANFPSENLTLAAGACIFHLASERVVVCYHSRDHYWFLPKGRKNALETLERAAEREAFEESGYRNRLLPLPMRHRQPDPEGGGPEFVTEACWVQCLPLTERVQYLLFWYVAETLPPELEEGDSSEGRYRVPEAYPGGLSLKARIEMDVVEEEGGARKVYEPVRYSGTAQDEEERWYVSHLLPIADAVGKLRGSVMGDVVRRGWEGVQGRMKMEEGRGG